MLDLDLTLTEPEDLSLFSAARGCKGQDCWAVGQREKEKSAAEIMCRAPRCGPRMLAASCPFPGRFVFIVCAFAV